MVIESPTQKKTSLIIAFMCSWAKALLEKFKAKTIEITKKTKKIGKDDPRRIIHSLKVALALTLVSMFYYLRPLYDGFGAAGMWAVLTVVVIFEFSVGATLCKGLNRGLATFLAGAFGIGANYLANLLGETGEPILLGLLVFILGAASTFTRFFPVIKARYDYGAVIFLLTFSLVAVSGYRVDEIIELAHQRLSTIIAGGAICIVVSIFICPVWAGEDLHNLLVLNLEKLASFLEGFGGEYFKLPQDGGSTMISKDDKSYLQGYKSVLNSKSSEESLANFAWWEPCHGQFRFRHPWKQYLKIGGLTRQCAYKVEALSGYLHFDIQEPSEFQRKIQESCYKMSSELAKALKELASVIKTMSCPSCSNIHIEKSKIAVDELKTALLKVSSSLEKAELIEIIPSITAASILIEIINCVEKITESVHDLSLLANFKKGKQQLLQRGIVKPISEGDSGGDDHVVITVEKEGPQVNKNNKTMEL